MEGQSMPAPIDQRLQIAVGALQGGLIVLQVFNLRRALRNLRASKAELKAWGVDQ